MSSILDRLAKILNQAERASTSAEAETYMKKAHELAANYSVDLALARAHTAKGEARETPTHKRISFGHLVKVNQRKSHVELWSAICGGHGLKMNIAHNSTYVIVFGMPSDIEVAEALYASLAYQMTKDADAHIRSGAYKEDVVEQRKAVYVYEEDWYTGRKTHRYFSHYDYVTKPLDGRVARRAFLTGFIDKVSSRMMQAKREAEAAAKDLVVEVEDAAPTTGALVLVAKGVEVYDYYKATSTARGSWQGHSSSAPRGTSYTAGTPAGSRANLGGQRALA